MRSFVIRTSLMLLCLAAAMHLLLVVQAIAQASMAEQGTQIWSLVWGKTLLVDVYLGLLATALLVMILERFRPWSWALALAIVALGNAPLVFYLAWRFWPKNTATTG